jgi:hypothetical protein
MKFAAKLISCMLTCPWKLHDCAHVRVFLSVWFSVQHVELVVSQQLQNQQVSTQVKILWDIVWQVRE